MTVCRAPPSTFSSATAFIRKNPTSGSRERTARRPFTQSCSKAGPSTFACHTPASSTCHPPITRPPEITGLAPSAATSRSGPFAVPESSGVSTNGAVQRCTPSANTSSMVSSGFSFRTSLAIPKAAATSSPGFTSIRTAAPTVPASKNIIKKRIFPLPLHRAQSVPLLRLLRRDPVEEIRIAAAGSALSNRSAPAFLSMLLENAL